MARCRGPNGNDIKELLALWVVYYVRNDSWIFAINVDYHEELQKVVDQDEATEETTTM